MILQKLNKRLQGTVAWIIVVLVAITFTLFGVEYYMQSRQSPSDIIVEINHKSISKQYFDTQYERFRRMIDSQQKTPIAEQQLKQTLLNDLISKRIALDSAEHFGFYLSRTQADQAIMQIPQFQENHHFSPERYQQILSHGLLTHDTFQQEVLQDLLLNQQRFAFIATAFALPSEVDTFIKQDAQKRDYRYLLISDDLFLNKLIISSDEIKKYYQKHAQQYQDPMTVSLDVVRLAMPNIKSQIQVTEADIVAYYKQTGDLKPLSEVHSMIEAQLLLERAQFAFSTKFERLSDLSYETPESLEPVAKALHLPMERTPFFSQVGGESDLTKNPKVIQAAFSRDVLELGNNSAPIQLDDETVIVLRVADHTEPKQKPLDEVTQVIKKQLALLKAKQEAIKLGEAIWHTQDKTTREQLIKNNQLQWQLAKNKSKSSTSINQLAFNLAAHPGELTGSYLQDHAGYVVIELQHVADGQVSKVDSKQRADIQKQLALQQGQLDYDLYLQYILRQAKIKQY